MPTTSSSLAAISALVLAPSLALAHFDFVPRVSDGKVAAAGHDDANGLDVPSLTVSGFDFGENLDDPYNIADPGFNSLGPTSFTPSSQLRLVPLGVAGSYLRYWDGTGEPAFAPASPSVRIDLVGSPSRKVSFTASAATLTPSSSTSLLVGTFDAVNAALHVHLGSSIYFAGLQQPDTVPVGAYLLSFQLINPGTPVAGSDPLFIVFNNGLTEELHDDAIALVQSSYARAVVPEPATLALLAPTLLLITRTRTRRT